MSTHDSIINTITGSYDRPYECLTCDESYEVEYYVCPNCGGFSVERT